MIDTSEVMSRVRDEARRRGVRWTNQRQVIVETFLGSGEHITVDELHRRVRHIDASVSSATVYRTVNMLVEMAVAQKRHFGTASATFECTLAKEHHDHLVCLSCGKIVEFHLDVIERLQEQVAGTHGYHLTNHRLELYGQCGDCRAAGREIPPLPQPSAK